MEIAELSKRKDLTDKAVQYFWKCWGSDSNFEFYQDCMLNSVDPRNALPKFYILADNNEIIASYALVTNDLISRQDLYPWLACLFVNSEHRNKGFAELLLNHGLAETRKKGFDRLYLSTDLDNFYEKKGWAFFATGFNIEGSAIKIYSKSTACEKTTQAPGKEI
jgi:N-acetylglutamate synthase-like GNAT family acetyltransferase